MKKCHQGFTLIELAIVMLVLTVLAAGLLVPLTRRIETQHYETTQKTLDEARDALIGYAMSHSMNVRLTIAPPATCPVPVDSSGTCVVQRHYLPCPDTDNDGIEQPRVGTACPANAGSFPWVTLGIANADAWGNRLYYAVDSNYSQPFASSTGPADNLQVCGSANCPPGTLIATNLAAIITSRGKNGWGAINSNSTNGIPQTAPTSADEQENTNGNANFVSRPASEASSTTSEFDDLVVWLPVSTLLARVCPAGGCP